MTEPTHSDDSDPEADDSDDEGWSDNEDSAPIVKKSVPTPSFGKPAASKPPKKSSSPSAPKPGPPAPKPGAPKPPAPSAPKPSSKPGPPSAPKPSAPKPAAKPMSWKERNAIAKKEAEAKRAKEAEARKEKMASVTGPSSAAPKKPSAPSPSRLTSSLPSRTSSSGGGGASASELAAKDAEIEELKAKNKELTEKAIMDDKKIFDLERETDTLRKRISEVEAAPGKQRRDSAAFADSINLMATKSEEIDKIRADLLEARKTIEDLKRNSKNISAPAGTSSSLDMKEMSSLREQLYRTKKEKEKALKLVIKMVGKQNLAQHLKLHESTGDGLSSLVASFGGMGTGSRPNAAASPKKPNGPSMLNSPGSEYKRSRVESYYRASVPGI